MNFTRVGSPLRVRTLVRSSQTPISPKPPVARTATHTYRLVRLAHTKVVAMIAVRMTMPPIVGVPFFVRCRSGVSSRIVSPPCCSTRSRRISHGAISSEMISAEIRAMNERNVR